MELRAATDDAAIREEASELLADLIRIDTTNPPGRETAAAEFLAAYLEREGIECELVAREPERANLVARIRGRGEGPTLCLLGHTDVVYADADDWAVDPFGGVVQDDHVWGRGALDMKSQTACNAVALARLARSGFRPNGDLLLIADADEEDGCDHVGLDWLVAERPDLRCDYALNEGGGERLELADGRVVWTLGNAEKATMPVRVVVRGTAGHASVPDGGDNALARLGPVLERLAAHRTTPSLEPEQVALLDALAPGGGELAERIERARGQHRRFDGELRALLGSTMTPTMVSASRARNVIPAQAEVVCDCRVLPGTTPDRLFAEFREVLADLPVELELVEPPLGGTRSPVDTPLGDVVREFVDSLDPGAEVLPLMGTGFTNSHFLREAFGTVAYGFFPLRHTAYSVFADTPHAADERVHRDDLVLATRFFEHAARRIGALA